MGREKKAKTKFKKVVSEQFPVNPKKGGGIQQRAVSQGNEP